MMGSAQAGSSTLDDLMLAYTDLSVSAKGHGQGFKGPPVKDIRREAPSKVFQHSNKARDWKTLDQSLESAFGATAPSPAQSISTAMAFTAQPQLLGAAKPTQPAQNCDFDEWGDFQDFSAPLNISSPPVSLLDNIPFSAPPPPSTHTSQAVGCRLATFQDESPVHRFKTVLPAPVPTPHNIPVKIPNFSAPPLSLQRPPSQSQHKSQPSSILDLDDEFGDFAVPSTRSFTSLTSSNISLSTSKSFSSTFPIDQPLQPMPKHQNTFPIDRPISISNTFPIDKPVSVNKTFSIDEPVAVAASSSSAVVFPPVVSMPLAAAPLAPIASSSSDKYSALRLFLDQPEESTNVSQDAITNSVDPPAIADIGANKSANPFNPFDSTNQADFGDTDFGDFVEVAPAPPVSNVVKAPPNFSLSDLFSQPNHPQPNLPDLLSSPQTNMFPSQLVSPHPSSAPHGSNKSSSNFPLQFTSPQPRNFPTLLPSPTNQNEDQNLDEWSLPSTSHISYENEMPTTTPTYKPPKPTTIPFHCSSPPPANAPVPSILSSSPPLMESPGSQLNVEEFSLPSEQFGFSDQEIFGIKKVKKESSQPQSIQDILSYSKKNKICSESPKHTEESIEEVKAAEPNSPSLENSRQGSPSSLRVPSKSPESQSVASLEFDNQNDPSKPINDKKPESDSLDTKGMFSSPPLARYNGFLTDEPKPSSSPYKEWCLLLSEILTLIESTRDTFDNIISEDLKEEVITSEQGINFLQNLSLVHKVYSRVAISYRQRVGMEEVKQGLEEVGQFCDEIDRDWQRLKEHCESYDVLTKPDPDVVEGDGVCSVCLGVGGGLVYGGAAYHTECANYWVNCVRDTLPGLG